MNWKYLFLLTGLYMPGLIYGQTISSGDSADPVWIKMIDDPNTNYYQALKAYEDYWQGKEKPPEEDDIIGEKMNRKEEREHEKQEKRISRMSPAEHNAYDRLKYECKRFENWKHEVFPFVQEDGRILSSSEREAIWKKQQEEIAKQKKSEK